MKNTIKVIGFDADDTLWANESYYRNTEEAVCKLLKDFDTPENISALLYETEMQNLQIYGYGAKAFMLSLIETTLHASNHSVKQTVLEEIINLGKALLEHPIDLFPDVEETLTELKNRGYRLIAITKGELLDQQRKFAKSDIATYFDSIEILSNKKTTEYQKVWTKLKIVPAEFLMVGNSLKSDILPVVELGGQAVYIPHQTTWLHETIPASKVPTGQFHEIKKMDELLLLLNQ